MIRTFSLTLALLGTFFQTASAVAPQEELCKVEQDYINTAIFVDGNFTQSFRTCSKGAISYVELIAAVDFNGGYLDVAILDDDYTRKAMTTVTAANYNGTSLLLSNLAIPALKNDGFTIMVRAYDGATCVIPGTEEAHQFVGEARLNNSVLNKNAKFSSGIRGAEPTLDAANDGKKSGISTDDVPANVMSRSASGLDLAVSGDCITAQRESNGVINVNGGGFMQTFTSCNRGRVVEIKLATPFVEPGFDYEYALIHFNGDVISSGTFNNENVTDGELKLTFDNGSVRKDQRLALKVTCPEGARMAILAKGVNNTDFGRLYVDGQAVPFNAAMAVGLEVATAEDVQATDEGRAEISLSAFPIPCGDVLNVDIRGTLQDGALLQVLDHQGMPVKAISLTAGKLDRPVRFTDLGNLRPGIYSLRLLSGRQVVSIRILKS